MVMATIHTAGVPRPGCRPSHGTVPRFASVRRQTRASLPDGARMNRRSRFRMSLIVYCRHQRPGMIDDFSVNKLVLTVRILSDGELYAVGREMQR